MVTSYQRLEPTSNKAFMLRAGLWFGALTVAFFLLVQLIPSDILFTGVPIVSGAAALLCSLVYAAWSLARVRNRDAQNTTFSVALVAWWFLLVSEELFIRINTTQNAFQGRFSQAAYYEAATWGLVFLVIVFVSFFRPHYLRQMFSGSYKWASFFLLLVMASVPLSPVPLYSLAWACKLALVILLVRLCLVDECSLNGVVTFLQVSLWGFLFLTVIPIARVVMDPSPAFQKGRLNEGVVSADGLSHVGATMLLLSLTLYALERRRWMIPFGVVGSAVMILAMGKAAIVAGTISAALFFLLQKRIASSFTLVVAISILGITIVAVTPASDYLSDYLHSGEAARLTGRVDLWSLAIPEITQSPILGHGYVASKFLSIQVKQIAMTVTPETGHLHNGFLEVLYNNGLLGLALVLLMHWSILRNLLIAMKHPLTRNSYLLTVGGVVLYINILLNGLFNASFGGHAYSPFMLLLALILISEKLPRVSQRRAFGTS